MNVTHHYRNWHRTLLWIAPDITTNGTKHYREWYRRLPSMAPNIAVNVTDHYRNWHRPLPWMAPNITVANEKNLIKSEWNSETRYLIPKRTFPHHQIRMFLILIARQKSNFKNNCFCKGWEQARFLTATVSLNLELRDKKLKKVTNNLSADMLEQAIFFAVRFISHNRS